jgi:hypothetical protein
MDIPARNHNGQSFRNKPHNRPLSAAARINPLITPLKGLITLGQVSNRASGIYHLLGGRCDKEITCGNYRITCHIALLVRDDLEMLNA